MKIIDYNDLQFETSLKNKKSAVTIGVFDGIHRGHMMLLKEVVHAPDLHSVVVTFRQNPKQMLRPNSFGGCILTQKQKLEHLESFGVDTVVLIDFSVKFSKLRGEDFIKYLSDTIAIRKLVVGSNFRCGAGASFSAADIFDYFSNVEDNEVIIVKQLKLANGKRVSSSMIRQLITHGEMKNAAELLDREYSLDVSNASFDCVGENIKLHIDEIQQLLPPPGLYRISVSDSVSTTAGKMRIGTQAIAISVKCSELSLKEKEIFITEKLNDLEGE